MELSEQLQIRYQNYLNNMAKQEKTPMTRPMPKQTMGINKVGKATKVVKAVKGMVKKKMC